jgi:enamine deaminase RidA (YjgF/YER057c/UK114 family)
MSIQRYHTGTRMSQIVVYGGTVYLAGQVGEADTSVEAQTREALRRVETLLAEVGCRREDLLQVIVWLADIGDFAAMNAVWDAWVPAGHAPTRACGEARLAAPGLKVEVIATAATTASREVSEPVQDMLRSMVDRF